MKKPNILLILADQHRQDCLSVYGNNDIITPNIEKISHDGVTYDSHFCPYPVCTPSRYSMLTAKYPSVYSWNNNYCTLQAGVETFPKILRREGYRTAAVGKMHFTPTYLDVGYDKMFLAEQDGPGRFDDDYHRYLKEHGLIDAVDLIDQRSEYRKSAPEDYWKTFGAMKSDLPEEHHSTTWITDRAIDIINGWEGSGNLLAVGYIKPHHPFDPPGKYAGLYNKDSLPLLPGYTETIPGADMVGKHYYFDYTKLDVDMLRHVMAMYYGTITHIDDSIGRMVSLLKNKGLYDDTMILYTADHGEYMGFHHLLLKGGYMYDPLMKVPLIIKYPGGRQKNSRNAALTSTIDIPSIILSECGVDIPEAMQTYKRGNYAFAEFCIGERQFMVRSDTHKLLVNGSMDNIKLYDMRNDPFELCDISGNIENNEIIEHLKSKLLQEFLFTCEKSYSDINAPAIRIYSADSHDEMEKYMQVHSPYKPVFE